MYSDHLLFRVLANEMKTRRSSPRKRSLREASSPDNASGYNDSSNIGDQATSEPRSLKRASISPPLTSKIEERELLQGNGKDDCNSDEVQFLDSNPPLQSTETIHKAINDGNPGDFDALNRIEPLPGPSPAVFTSSIALYPHTTSAYLQSLAEICHAILWDARWRVGGSQQNRLFAWEQGDDMNALHKFSRRYIPLPKPSKRQSQDGNIDEEKENSGSNSKNEKNDHIEKSQRNDVEFEPDDRCLETYSRLYFRKGPWFRLDNIYKSYYIPKMCQSTEPSVEMAGSPMKKPPSPSKFFRRRNTKDGNKNNRRSSLSEDDYIDHEDVDLQMEAVVLLLEDIKRLFCMGLIRTFLNEEECGKTVGKRQGKYQNATASLLRLDEQRTVLSKLGGGQKQKKRAPNPSSATKPSLERQEKPLENLIWKQMCQQQTIFNCFKNGRNNTVLPVIKHVHEILLQKWASTIVWKASKVEYVPSPILRSATKEVYNVLSELTSKLGVTSTLMCIRLREAPVRTLQRACRLYLCATSGPGDMRNTGTNAWRCLPYSHTKDLRSMPLRTNVVAPPGSSWNTLSYPGKDWRLRVQSYQFMNAFQPMIVNESHHDCNNDDREVVMKEKADSNLRSEMSDVNRTAMPLHQEDVQVFFSVEAFHQWEIGVELREICDYLLELNELILYNERKRAREAKGEPKSDNESEEVDNENVCKSTDQSSSEDEDSELAETKVDFLDLLTITGRAKVIRGFLALQKNDGREIISKIEQDVSTLLGVSLGDRPLSALIIPASTDSGLSQCIEGSHLKNECERILGVIGIILIHVLELLNTSINPTEGSRMVKRPWLRHLNWGGCMSYVLWDVIPILERRGYYEFAISALEVLLFGKRLARTTSKPIADCFVGVRVSNRSDFIPPFQPLISRRARGKALDRLIIDYTHFARKNNDLFGATETETRHPAESKSKSKAKKKAATKSAANKIVQLLTEPLIRTSVVSGKISFSSIRTLARRLKRPLSRTLEGLESYEASELGHRFSNADDEPQDATKYNDWTPITDTTVANAMANNEDSAVGGRCSFVGFEEDEHAVRMGSLNVEELAKEYYNQGRLPIGDEFPTKGGWIGYHDEGGKIRLLFRILSSTVLGMDWDLTANPLASAFEASTIHLTPYQGAPFDLHVGAERVENSKVQCSGIYVRRKSQIDNFLARLSMLKGEDLSDFVYDCINKRVQYTNSQHRPDLILESDLEKVRTLSMLAVGFGGKMLASIFRCFFFDYRHYSGGLPDLLLVRALYASSGDSEKEELVDLGEWVGEEFSREYQEALKANQIARIFTDTDGDFLGCSKVGDSGARPNNRFQRPGRLRNNTSNTGKEGDSSNDKNSKTPYKMPKKLILSHDSREVRVECMFVEVKSQNDRLDSRQEDWLNILDLHGNARVCKFEKTPKRDKGAS